MTYKDCKVLCEHLHSLNYHRKISVSNFSEPNFELVSEILCWAANLTDSNTTLTKDIETEAQRVLFIRSCAEFFGQHLDLRLNTKELYAAQAKAVPELLKVTGPLYKASQKAQNSLNVCQEENDPEIDSPTPNTSAQDKELSKLRQSASDVIQSAASLHQQLNDEVEARLCREAALARDLDLSNLEETVGRSVTIHSQKVQDIKENTQQLILQEKEIDEKIARKKEMLNRNRKRLDTLKNIKPSWESEFELCERELSILWGEYVKKHMSLTAMEKELDSAQFTIFDTSKNVTGNSKSSIVNTVGTEIANDDEDTSAAVNKKSSDPHIFGDMFGNNIDSAVESLTDDWSSASSDNFDI